MIFIVQIIVVALFPLVAGFGQTALVQSNTGIVVNVNTAAFPHRFSSSPNVIRQVSTESTVISTTENIYTPESKEVPKVLGGVKIGLRKLVVVTGASSGLGLSTTIALAKTGKYHIVMACRDIDKAKRGK